MLPTNYMIRGQAPVNDIKITSPNKGAVVPVGNLTINGTSSDNANSDCQVYVDWNNLKPFQNARPTGAAGANDYSNWTFTYTNDYHLITKGSNELTANLFCLDNPSAAAYSSIKIIGQSPKISDTGTTSDTGTRQYSGDHSGRDSREETFKFVRFCVIVEDYSNEDNTVDDNTVDDNTAHKKTGDDNTVDDNTAHKKTGDDNTAHKKTGNKKTVDDECACQKMKKDEIAKKEESGSKATECKKQDYMNINNIRPDKIKKIEIVMSC